jgi:hypothetical protein
MTPMEGMKPGRRHATGKQHHRAPNAKPDPEHFEPAPPCLCDTPQPRREGPLITCQWCSRVIK